MARPDPFIRLLRGIDFVPLRLPRAGVQPLMLASLEGKEFTLLGNLADAMEEGGPPPPAIFTDIETAGAVESTRTSSMKLSVGLGVVQNLVAGITGNAIDVSQHFQGASALALELGGVTVDRVDLVKVDRYLSQTGIHRDSRHLRKLLIAARCAVLTATARCRRYVVSALREDGSALAIDAPLLQQAASGALRISRASGDTSRIVYEGPTALTFGIQAARLFYTLDGRYSAFRPLPAEGAARGPAMRPPQPDMVTAEGLFVDLRDPAAA
jgi:hypothetical protein